MGNAALQGAKANVDKRESRLRNRESFRSAITTWQKNNQEQGTHQIAHDSNRIKVYIRKRPLFRQELERDFDVISCNHESSTMTVFKCSMKADLKQMYLTPYRFPCDGVFDTPDYPEEVYDGAVKGLVSHALEGGLSTAFMFGATGSGKTYTMSAIVKGICRDLHQTCDTGAQKCQYLLRYYELSGSSARDLLGNKPVKLLQGADGNVHSVGASVHRCNSAEELLDLITKASAQRASAENAVHDSSSRSHAICDIRFSCNSLGGDSALEETVEMSVEDDFSYEYAGMPTNKSRGTPPHPETDDSSSMGTLLLIDLAGSERNKDSLMLSSHQRRSETIQINQSLMALKDCARASLRGSAHVPFRASKLTHLLKASFTSEKSRTVVIGTVSPSSGDTEHSLSTLLSICMMGNSEGESEQFTDAKENRMVDQYRGFALNSVGVVNVVEEEQTKEYVAAQSQNPIRWTSQQLGMWWSNCADTASFPAPNVPGTSMARWSLARFEQQCGSKQGGQIAQKAWKQEITNFKTLRQEIVKKKLAEKNRHMR